MHLSRSAIKNDKRDSDGRVNQLLIEIEMADLLVGAFPFKLSTECGGPATRFWCDTSHNAIKSEYNGNFSTLLLHILWIFLFVFFFVHSCLLHRYNSMSSNVEIYLFAAAVTHTHRHGIVCIVTVNIFSVGLLLCPGVCFSVCVVHLPAILASLLFISRAFS